MIDLNIYNILALISAFSVIIPIIFIYPKRRESLAFIYLSIYLIISLLTEIVHLSLRLANFPTPYIGEVFKLVELILIVEIYRSSGLFAKKQTLSFRIISLLGAILLVVGLMINWTGVFDGICHASIIFLSLVSFYKMFLVTDAEYDELHDFFWFNAAFFVYFSASLLLFLYGNLIRSNETISKWLWTIHLLANMFYYYLLTLGIWKRKAI